MGVNNVGHCHPKVMSAVRDQIGTLIHIPNNFLSPEPGQAGQGDHPLVVPGQGIFCNSGAEGCEAAIKFARAYGKGKRHEIITMTNSFHGRNDGSARRDGTGEVSEWISPASSGGSK